MTEESRKVNQVILVLDRLLIYDGKCPNQFYHVSDKSCTNPSGRYFYSRKGSTKGKLLTPCQLHLAFYLKNDFDEYFPEET